VRLTFLLFVLSFCLGCGSAWGSQPTRVEPLPLKVGGLKDSSIEFAVPIANERKKHGGFRSPVEVRGRVLLTAPDYVRIPLIPAGGVVGIRIRW